jgi:hypothetical protein
VIDCSNYFFIKTGNDSWHPMIKALIWYKENPDTALYNKLLIEDSIKFQYPPTSLLIFDIPQRITGFSYEKITALYNRLSWCSVFLTAIFTSKILTSVIKHIHTYIHTYIHTIIQYLVIGLFTLFFYPLMKSYNLGQVQTILTMLATFVMYFYLSGNKKITGLCLGLICLIKPQLGLLFLWGIIRKEWTMVITGSITVISILLISISFYGFHNHLDYLSALSFLSKHGECFYPNQSINGIMNRLLFNGNNLYWSADTFPPYNTLVYLSTLFSSLFLITLGLFWNYKSKHPNIIEFSIMMLCATIASPIAWEQHYGILLPIFILLSPFMIHYCKNKKWKLLVFGLAFVGSSQFFIVTLKLANSYFNIFQSYLLFSALIILLFMFYVSKKMKNENCSI